jgi:predicted house-cleaning noncanonical NTP pyrophosphatase (MazG superfamily)
MERNKREETKLREEYKKADRLYSENLANYDAEMKEQTRNKEQATEQYE